MGAFCFSNKDRQLSSYSSYILGKRIPYCKQERINGLEKEGPSAENLALIITVMALLAMKYYHHSLLKGDLL